MGLDLSDRDLRQRDVVPPEKLAGCQALVIGVGAVGRQVALQLSAMGIGSLTLLDHDIVEIVNLATQGYLVEELGQTKVAATASWCRRLNPEMQIECHPDRFGRSSPKTLSCFQISDQRLAVFTCVDSITARSIVWESVKSRASFYADARMSAEVIRSLASDHPADDQQYATTLFRQDEAFRGVCTARGTIYCGCIAAGLMLSQFTRWLRGMSVERDVTLNLLASELVVA